MHAGQTAILCLLQLACRNRCAPQQHASLTQRHMRAVQQQFGVCPCMTAPVDCKHMVQFWHLKLHLSTFCQQIV